CDLRFRRPTLYPPELLAHGWSAGRGTVPNRARPAGSPAPDERRRRELGLAPFLAEHLAGERDDHDDCRRAGRERDHRGHKQQPDAGGPAGAHPPARSTTMTSKALPPGGVTSKSSPQWPAITSAGKER